MVLISLHLTPFKMVWDPLISFMKLYFSCLLIY